MAAYDPAPGNTTQDKPALHAISEVVINSNDCNASLPAHSVPLLSLSFGKTRGTPKLHVALQPPSIDTVPTALFGRDFDAAWITSPGRYVISPKCDSTR